MIANLPEAERRSVLAEVEGWPESGAGVELPYRVEINLARALPAPGPGSDRAAI